MFLLLFLLLLKGVAQHITPSVMPVALWACLGQEMGTAKHSNYPKWHPTLGFIPDIDSKEPSPDQMVRAVVFSPDLISVLLHISSLSLLYEEECYDQRKIIQDCKSATIPSIRVTSHSLFFYSIIPDRTTIFNIFQQLLLANPSHPYLPHLLREVGFFFSYYT